MTDPTVTQLGPAPLHVLEIWSDPNAVAARLLAELDLPLPPLGRSSAGPAMIFIRVEPTVWLVEGDVAALGRLIGDDGTLTAIGGGVVRVRIAGAGWRRLLMENGFFDAQAAGFAAGCSAATIIDHVAVRLWVESDDACIAYVPASYAAGLIDFWQDTADLIGDVARGP